MGADVSGPKDTGVRAGGSSEEGSGTGRPGGSPVLFALMVLVVVPSVILADRFGAGPAATLGGMVGLFAVVVLTGGPLRGDLRMAAAMVPLLFFAAVVPRLLAEVWRPAGIALVVVIVFAAALLPLRGARFANAGLGLGMATLFAYGYAINGRADHRQLVVAVLAGLAVALVLRVLMGVRDPSQQTRAEAAEVLVADDPAAATATAFGTWLRDGRPRWLADVLDGASRYRLALRAAELAGRHPDAELAAVRARAEQLADRVRARTASDAHAEEWAGTGGAGGQAAAEGPLAGAAAGLDAVARAERGRDASPVTLDRDRRRELRDAVRHPSLRLRSIQVRHAFRTAFGLLVMLVVTAGLEPGDPLVSTVLLSTFGILQASWRDTLGKAVPKITGVAAGSAAVALVLLVVPARYLAVVGVVALCLGLWFIVTRPALGSAFMVLVSVGLNAATRDLDPVELLVQYALLTATAVLVGVVLGFVVVPAFRPPPLRARVLEATAATTAVLRAVAGGTGRPPLPELLALHREAVQKLDELVPDRERLDDAQLAELDRLRTALRDLVALADAAPLTPASLDDVLAALGPGEGAPPSASPAGAGSTWVDLAEQAGSAEHRLLATLPPAAARRPVGDGHA